jgi:uncharacterized membrane protein
MMGMSMIAAVLAALTGAVIAVIFSLRGSTRRRQLPSPPEPAQAKLVAAQLDALDLRLTSGQISQADYAAERNRLLGLPEPEQR